MNETLSLIPALLTGVALGVVFFGGLWWTIQKSVSSPWPAAWFSVSLFLRTAIAVTGFYFVSHRDWQRLLACLCGFFIARVLVTWLTRTPRTNSIVLIERRTP